MILWFIGDRTHLGLVIQWIANANLPHTLLQAFYYLIIDRTLHERTRSRDTRLTRSRKNACEKSCYCCVKGGIFKENIGRLPTQFKYHISIVPNRRSCNACSSSGRTGVLWNAPQQADHWLLIAPEYALPASPRLL